MKTFKIIAILLTAGIFCQLPQPAWAAVPQGKTGTVEVKMGIKAVNLGGEDVKSMDVSGCTFLKQNQ